MADLITSDSLIDDKALDTLTKLLNTMIPPSGDRPGAGDPEIVRDLISAAQELEAQVRNVLTLCETHALADVIALKTPDFSAFGALVLQCYYRDDRVMAAIGMEPRSPHPQGYDLEAGDWSLLDPVKARKPFYREV